jgi:redox-sensitive bicupin YhaK (pirin superfamily)
MSGGTFHGIQLWVNLPKAKKWETPRYQDIRAGRATLVTTPDGGALVRVIAGEVAGHTGPGVTHTPMAFVHATLSPGAELVLPWQRDFNALVYALAGDGSVGSGRRPFRTGQLAVFGKGDFVTVAANERQDSHTPNLDVIIIGGQPIKESMAWYGPFVMNTREEIIQAMDDFHAGRLGAIPASSLTA